MDKIAIAYPDPTELINVFVYIPIHKEYYAKTYKASEIIDLMVTFNPIYFAPLGEYFYRKDLIAYHHQN